MGIFYKCLMKNIHQNITHISLLIYLLPKRYIKRYKRKYLGWLQGETRKLHKISEDKNLTESLHSIPCEIWHGVQNFAQPCEISCCWISSSSFPSCISYWLCNGLWSAPKIGFFMYLSFNLHCHEFHQILPHSWLVSMIK